MKKSSKTIRKKLINKHLILLKKFLSNYFKEYYSSYIEINNDSIFLIEKIFNYDKNIFWFRMSNLYFFSYAFAHFLDAIINKYTNKYFKKNRIKKYKKDIIQLRNHLINTFWR